MLSKVSTAALSGIDAFTVYLEVDLARQGLPAFTMVGLAEGAVRESKERVFSALKNSGYRLPPSRITVNLAPADMRKEGSAYDLPLALGLLAASGAIDPEALSGWYLAAELSLAGELKPVPGVLPLAIRARDEKARGLIVPPANASEAAVVEGLDVFSPPDLATCVKFLTGQAPLNPARFNPEPAEPEDLLSVLDYRDVKGQEHAKRAIEIAAAGAHNLLFLGPPGSGKTMLAQRLPTVLPPLVFEEALEVTKIYSVSGQLRRGQALMRQRPFRAPHHTISDAGLIGGGSYPRPGEVSMAHKGVLFLDELPEFKKTALEVLRQPMEDGSVRIARAAISLSYPADFMLVAAMNPCPCGYFGDHQHTCLCGPKDVQRYRSRISGPLLDRIDLQVEVPAVPYKDLKQDAGSLSSAEMRSRVLAAREIQQQRYKSQTLHTNSQLTGRSLAKFCRLGADEHGLLEEAVRKLGLSARAHTRILRIARTIADLEAAADLNPGHIAEAIAYRNLDRQN